MTDYEKLLGVLWEIGVPVEENPPGNGADGWLEIPLNGGGIYCSEPDDITFWFSPDGSYKDVEAM